MADQTRAGCVLVTGASGGMGTAICRALIADGRRVILADREAGPVQALAAELGSSAHAVVLDITDAGAVEGLPASVPQGFGHIEVLINNAGHDIGGRTRFDVGAMEDWAGIIETNLVGTLRVTRAILPDMVARNRGDIVMMSSINALRIIPDMAAYSTSKSAIHAFTETLRAELAETGIRVTEINPGLTKTGIIRRRYRGDTVKEKAYFDQFKLALEPEDIARAVMFALSQPEHVQVAQMVVLPVNRW
jgi:3-hydroxy acid dehydrogenase / malonic semialdehyde reductase